MSVHSYYEGETVLLTGTFTRNGDPVDPTSVSCRVSDPADMVTTPVVTQTSAGIYTAQVTVNAHGMWGYEFIGTGANPQINYGEFKVKPAPF